MTILTCPDCKNTFIIGCRNAPSKKYKYSCPYCKAKVWIIKKEGYYEVCTDDNFIEVKNFQMNRSKEVEKDGVI